MTHDEMPWRLVDGRDHASAATRLRVRCRLETARLIDRAMARSGLARPVVFVSGFWRSGTTWLQECLAEALGAKTVFEPLSPFNPPRGAALTTLFPGDEDAAQAYIPGPDDGLDGIWTLFDRAMASDGCDAFALSCRWTVRESLRRSVVLKDVRSQRILAHVRARYGLPVVHVRRHPCAVVSSLVRAKWHWSFARVRLSALLPAPGMDGMGDPRRFDEDEISRIAACWAWSERCAAESLADQPWGRVIAYERMARHPGRVLQETCAALGLRPTAAVTFDRASATIQPAEHQTRTAEPERWRQHLTAADIDRVERIATAVFPAWRNAWQPTIG